jgi:hypothetical protein
LRPSNRCGVREGPIKAGNTGGLIAGGIVTDQ